MIPLLLLLCKTGMLMALLTSTDRTVTVSKNLTEQVKTNDTYCGEKCNVKCHLQNQNLDVLPTCLPKTIEDLDLNFNNITVIGIQDVVYLPKLRILSLSHNQIREIHWRIHVLPELESLDLSHNLLSVVPKCLMLKNLRKLSLAGNPILLIQPFAFSCFPNLVFLNLSSTLIGFNSFDDIQESVFALNSTQAQEGSLKTLELLDLSGTYIRCVKRSWSKDLSNLRELHIRKMIRMNVLEDELIAWFPHLERLNCADSKSLATIRTEIFQNASNLVYLDFRNCSIKYFSPWKISSQSLTIDLRGNPLLCQCELDWLVSKNTNLSLTRPNETFCSSLTGDVSRISILELHKQCQSSQSEPSDEAQDSVTSTTEVRKSDFIPGTTEDSLNSALSLHTIGQKDLLLSTTDLLTTVFENDPTTSFSITQSSSVTPKTSSSSDVLPKELTDLPITKQTFPENGSSSWNQSEIPRDYPEDYDEQETQPIVTTVGSRITACDYDHCRHLQTPCSELQRLKPCMCPGLSGDHLIPDPPHLQGVFEITDTSAQILWCSPNSIVEKYQLVYDHESDANQTVDNIYVTMRQFTLYNLVPHTTYKVCVMAFNKKGHSAPINNGSRTPCAEFKTRPSYILILSILSALGGLFLAAIAVLSICLYKACKNSVSKYDTHLVSYKNPAFEYHCTIPSYH